MKLTCEKISKIYPSNTKVEEVKALDEVSLEIQSGEHVFIIGESGAGKTTLLNVIALLEHNYDGVYQIDGQDVKNISSKEKVAYRNSVFGLLFQEYALLEEDSVYENIEIPLIYSKKYKRSKRKERINEVAKVMQLTNCLYQKVKNLSGGQRQRVGIARALVNNPDILILDEPTGALNRAISDMIMYYIYDYVNNNHKTMIIVTHDIEKIKKHAGRVITISDGKIIKDEYY